MSNPTHIDGDIGPGSVIGDGQVHAQNIAGGDINIYKQEAPLKSSRM